MRVLTSIAAVFATATVPPTIVLDRSIGGVHVRERRDVIELTLGRGIVTGSQNANQILTVRYVRSGITVGYVALPGAPSGKALSLFVTTTSPRYRTKSGLHVGSSYAALTRALRVRCSGDQCQHGYTRQGATGTTFFVDGGKVVKIALALGH